MDWYWSAANLNNFCVTGVVIPWHARALFRLRGCVVPGYAIAWTMVLLALYVLAEHMVIPARRAIASIFAGLTSVLLPRYFYRGKTTVIGTWDVSVIIRQFHYHPNRYKLNHAVPFPSKSLPKENHCIIPIQPNIVQKMNFPWFLVPIQPRTAI